MATKFQIKRSTVSGVVPTTFDIAPGELAVNLADKKLFTANTTSAFELGSNLTNLSVTGNLSVDREAMSSVKGLEIENNDSKTD